MLAQIETNNINLKLKFAGDHLIYKNNRIELGPKAFYIDGQLSDKEVNKYPFVFNSINKAVEHLTNGTEESPMTLYIAPWVYWIDNPDDVEIRIPKQGKSVPFGLEIECEWLKFYGLTDNPQDVILASNRGQTIGAKGNFTMLNIKGNGLSTHNITLGNFCNVDLNYELNPSLNRQKRASAIVQAQLVFSDGDKVVARNTHFISRLNLAPFWGSKRTLFDGCHFECTDDALNGCAVYLNCTFDFFSSKPFYNAPLTGAVFLNCDINCFTGGTQYLAKVASSITMVDTRIKGKNVKYIGWSPNTSIEEKYYQYNLLFNQSPLFIGSKDGASTIDLTNKDLLDAYLVKFNNKTIYNTYNLLRGDDDWDPMKIKPIILQIEKSTGKNYSKLPTQLKIKSSNIRIETNKDTLILEPEFNRFGGYPYSSNDLKWYIQSKFQSSVKLESLDNGRCRIIPINTLDETKDVIIEAISPLGLEAAVKLSVAPAFIDPPKFIDKPTLHFNNDVIELSYSLDMPYDDQSLITWYRCKDAKGEEAIEIAVSRFDKPMKQYKFTSADNGWYIKASIRPKHLRCNEGQATSVISKRPINNKNIQKKPNIYIPNLENLSTLYQPEIIDGFWSVDCYKPTDTNAQNWKVNNSKNAWFVGSGVNGAAKDTGLVQNVKGARLRFQPIGDSFWNMKLSFTAVPSKTAGQGFGSATDQYLDICIKMDLHSMSGYALRIFRTPKYGNAVDFQLMKYSNGEVSPIGKAISSTCYRGQCDISVEVINNRLIARADNRNNTPNLKDNKLVHSVHLETIVDSNQFGGVSIQHTGSIHAAATLIKNIKIEWK
ncbi:PemB family protein, partial [Carboxylicivirga linearis]